MKENVLERLKMAFVIFLVKNSKENVQSGA
jgi:hypothetical protein